ncbi:MAG TPA: hypothetical protein DCW90_05305 [Lachnospiraceae bacterium]|nr:hypothetical protein [Lachnospiraceae bacterium]
MTIIEKMYAGEELSEEELRILATGFSCFCNVEPGEYEEVGLLEKEFGRWTQQVTTVIKTGNDFWAIDWDRGLTEHQENEFYNQPYRVERKERMEKVVYYEAI